MNPKELYDTLERIAVLERTMPQSAKELDRSPGVARQYNALMDSLPQIISIDDLKTYHQYVAGVKAEEERSGRKKKVQTILDGLKDTCSPEAYDLLESKLSGL
ncbi:hypothetical protein HOE37_02080 [Candidatus Woesearchaeota archaeon]|jgi:hypothetical protein|nr:hypothetical protein [Candidatus Woesearchaeota archaeon]MBT4110622.1 hypothetical protein [Candidatus Woesearchaeota archaeon]MBT4335854.1 hypothetical protein [Candidatus Woesearchaeota archaeon]MBT4469167.1 hypothetical protein [Candidatus Woesearchaeota archaeon]MBT6744514.1 hypothetical protein [Candidatus Woesearchaeota archaeon]